MAKAKTKTKQRTKNKQTNKKSTAQSIHTTVEERAVTWCKMSEEFCLIYRLAFEAYLALCE